MTVKLWHATGDCAGTFELRGIVNEHIRCDVCGATYAMVKNRVVYWPRRDNEGAAMMEGGT